MSVTYAQRNSAESEPLNSPAARRTAPSVLSDNRFLEDFASLSSDWFWEMDANLVHSYITDRFTEITGIPTSLVLGIANAQLGMLDDEVPGYVQLLNERQSFRGFTFSCMHPDGRDVVVSIDGDALFDESSKFVGYRGTGREVFALHRSTAAQENRVLDHLIGQIPNVGFWEWDETENRCLFCSSDLAEFCGITADEFIRLTRSIAGGRHWVHADDRQRYDASISAFRRDPRGFEIEYRMLAAAGPAADVYEVVAPILDQRGTLVRSFGFVRNVSSTKQAALRLQQSRDKLELRVQERTQELQLANAELKESRSRLSAAAQVARLGYFQWDSAVEQGISCSEQLAEILGAPVEECSTETSSEYMRRIHPDDADMVSAVYASSRKNNDSVDLEYRILRPGGDIRYVHELSTTSTDSEGKVIQNFGTLQDITERKVIANELADVEGRLHELGANAREVLYVLSADWREVIYVSAAFDEIWGQSRESVLADPRAWQSSIHPDDREMIKAEIEAKISGADPTPDFSDCRIISASGEIRWLFARVYPVRDKNGEIVRNAGVAEDITERKAAVEALHQSQKMDAVGKLTGGVAHDFNNLLAVILGNSSLLQDRIQEEDEPLLKDIIEAGNRGAALTQSLLAFSRLQPLQPVPTNVAELVEDMGELLRRTLGATVVVDIKSTTNKACAAVDPALLKNALLNLSLNARDALPEGGHLEIRVRRATADELPAANPSERTSQRYLAIAVKDNGVGMEPDVLSRALEPFFTTKDPGEGSGLGLPMVYGFAKQSDGDLLIDSTPDAGTVVTLYLPASR